MVRLDGFSTDDLVELAQVYNRLADRDDVSDRWQAWGREVAEAIAIELAGRLIAEGWADDPCAMAWFGRLPRPDEPGKWEAQP
jgi:hypothetical protein